ncbi:MAG: histidine phosphatase family protein [Planctomycetota bacterium]
MSKQVAFTRKLVAGSWCCSAILLSFILSISVHAEAPNSDVKTTYPRVIMIIRHGEKPSESEKSPDLSMRGNQRALALHELFVASEKHPKPFPSPDFIFAAAESKHSNRSFETVQYLAKNKNEQVNNRFSEENISDIANEIFHNKKYEGKIILISWHHGKIPELAKALHAEKIPKHWDGEGVFDRVWQITFDASGKAVFANLPQHVLPGDSKE